jgi:hypothetical protein
VGVDEHSLDPSINTDLYYRKYAAATASRAASIEPGPQTGQASFERVINDAKYMTTQTLPSR